MSRLTFDIKKFNQRHPLVKFVFESPVFENEKVSEELTEDQEVVVKCLDVDNRGRIKLSIKEVSVAEKSEFLGAVAASEA